MKLDVGWAYALFHFPVSITGKMVKEHIRTSNLQKQNYIGTYKFDEKYLNQMESDLMRGIKYYYVYFTPDDNN